MTWTNHDLHIRCSLRATVIYDIAQDTDTEADEEDEEILSNHNNNDTSNADNS